MQRSESRAVARLTAPFPHQLSAVPGSANGQLGRAGGVGSLCWGIEGFVDGLREELNVARIRGHEIKENA